MSNHAWTLIAFKVTITHWFNSLADISMQFLVHLMASWSKYYKNFKPDLVGLLSLNYLKLKQKVDTQLNSGYKNELETG